MAAPSASSDPILVRQLIRDEGLRLKPYTDSVGKLTIGVGHNLTDVGITREQALDILAEDIAAAEKLLDTELPWWRSLEAPRRRVLLNMAFNLGYRLLTFKNTLRAAQEGRYEDAAEGMRASKWARQVGKRANRLAATMQSNVDY
jgi:lysozyme